METAQVSRQGNRSDNQDRASIVVTDTRILLTVADGMGGHIGGDVAAETAIDALVRCFKRQKAGIRDAGDFLRESIVEAHEAVVMLGAALTPDLRPRTTITVCLIADNAATWAHVGDSRIYLMRDQKVFIRTRDHSAVELLVQQGLLKDADVHTHPMRNFVEQCLGGEPELPMITIADPRVLMPGDVILLCSDGFWAPQNEPHLAQELNSHMELQTTLDVLALEAEEKASPSSDNVTAVALRWID
ncbi:MAG: PP2C family protein-serine/threonine phosphatase [Bacillota bacterium]